MRGLLFAAGYGTRLRPITERLPKCLVQISGTPLLMQWFQKLTELDIAPILVNTHYLAEQVETSIQESRFEEAITIAFEKELLGTAGTIADNADFLSGDAVFIAHADNFCMSDLSRLVDAHERRPPGVEISMLTFVTDRPEECGIVTLDDRGVVTRFVEKSPDAEGRIASAAVFIITQSVVQDVKNHADTVFDFSKDVLPRYINRILAVPANGIHIDIGTHANLLKARSLGVGMA